jgi:hypothetical protein
MNIEVQASSPITINNYIKKQNADITVPCSTFIPIYTNCGGIIVTCGYIDITTDCNSNELLNIYYFSACADPTICNGVFGWG